MKQPVAHDAVVIGSGPNGLGAAVTLAGAGLSVLLAEAQANIGGGAANAELTLPGFRNDVCSAIHPMGASSPLFRSLPLARYGLEWLESPFAYAHPFDDGRAAAFAHSLDETVARLGSDGAAYRHLVEPFVRAHEKFLPDALRSLHVPRHPLLLGRFGLRAYHSASGIANRFKGRDAQVLVAGPAAHSAVPLTDLASSALSTMMLIAGHVVGWPFPRGGSQAIADALAAHFRALGGEIRTNTPIRSMADLPPARAYLFDVTPKQLLQIAGEQLPAAYRHRLSRFRYGPGAFKIDYALAAPIPWRANECRETATVHVGGPLEEIASAEAAVSRGEHPEKPFVIVTQPSLFDPTRAPAGRYTAWAYCHVPNGSTFDMQGRIEAQIERFAPGFRDCVLARCVRGPRQLEDHNPNLVGGDIAGGMTNWSQLLTRPVVRLDPYSTPNRQIFLCSSSTPPGGGVHGMCGYWAARSALHRVFGKARHVALP